MGSYMTEFKLIFFAYWQFYLRHKGLFLLFILGFSLGTALISAIYGLNLEASKRYTNSSALLAVPVTHFIKPNLGTERLPETVRKQLSRQTNIHFEVVLEGRVQLENNKWLSIKGVNLLHWASQSAPSSQAGLNAQNLSRKALFDTVFLDPKMIARLGSNRLNINGVSYHISPFEGLGYQALMDISLADRLLNANGEVSYLEVFDLDETATTNLNQALQGSARLERADSQAFDTLSGPFFFNLQALALLGYIVGAFLSFNAVKLAFSARTTLHKQLYLMGCQPSRLRQAMFIELGLLGLVCAYLGALFGVSLANVLVADVTQVLRSFYQLDRALTVQLNWSMVALGFVLNIAVLSGFFLSHRLTRLFAKKGVTWLILSGLCSGAVLLALFAKSKLVALFLCAVILLIFFCITPGVITRVFSTRWPVQSPLILWLKGDSQGQLKSLLSAVLATLMAMGAAIGMLVMVKSFSHTLDGHLESRLSADLYVRPAEVSTQMHSQLAQMPQVERVGVYWQARSELIDESKQIPLKLVSFGRDASFHQHVTLLGGHKVTAQHISPHQASMPRCLVNEPGWRLYGIETGRIVEVRQGRQVFECLVSGVFYDYGEQEATLLTATSVIEHSGFKYQAFGFSLSLINDDDINTVTEYLVEQMSIERTQVSVNKVFKQYAKQLFENTFSVTHALNIFIMLIALFGVWVSFLTLGRRQLQPMAVLQTLGVTRSQLLRAKLLQTLIILTVTIALAIPLGILLGWVLLTYVMPLAFGWSMAMILDWKSIFAFSLVVLSLAMFVGALPMLRLLKRNIADSVAKL
ncbi:ABC-type antimicrobial peptide transport system, permease component [Pseudoalteromonas luteoviolacea 2ta16]|uniref:ABC-type antimicrobial peptide transport system, permease component n=2 Tax=Pseudoalteromonas luteoviolacea TaxID=43657 RepID=V4HRY8_PSEL2|nr:ABC-type antimicrobial peptide transport system, permease component [Pseudoalteromonas luteoviolacea 2ta16]